MDIISSKTSQIKLNFKTSVRLSSAAIRRLKTSLKASLDECEAFALKKSKQHGLGLKKVESLELSLTLCGESKIKSLNKSFRQKNYATDVLSFPVHDDLRENTMPLPPELELGDIFICHQVAQRQAKEYKVTWEQEIMHLFAHGFLHLLGFDHEISTAEEKIMQKYETLIVKKSYQRLGLE